MITYLFMRQYDKVGHKMKGSSDESRSDTSLKFKVLQLRRMFKILTLT